MTSGPVAFVFKGGRETRADTDGPTEFFYGYPQLKRRGYDVTIVTDRDLALDVPPRWKPCRAISHAVYTLSGVPLWPLLRLWSRRSLDRLAPFRCLVVSTNIVGVCLAVLSRLNVLRQPVMFVAMGLIQPSTPRRVVRCYRWIFNSRVTIRALSAFDARMLSEQLGLPITHITFGVDAVFWTPGAGAAGEDYVLSMGNDAHRDYATLLAAWKPEYPRLRIVTKHRLTITAPNISVTHGDWHQQALTDQEVRSLIQGARFVVLPIVNTTQPSGQSVCLQAMSCAKAVVITDFDGLWNRELIRDGETCVLAGRPGDRVGLQTGIERLLREPALADAIGRRARLIIESDLNVERMAGQIAAEVDALLASAT